MNMKEKCWNLTSYIWHMYMLQNFNISIINPCCCDSNTISGYTDNSISGCDRCNWACLRGRGGREHVRSCWEANNDWEAEKWGVSPGCEMWAGSPGPGVGCPEHSDSEGMSSGISGIETFSGASLIKFELKQISVARAQVSGYQDILSSLINPK